MHKQLSRAKSMIISALMALVFSIGCMPPTTNPPGGSPSWVVATSYAPVFSTPNLRTIFGGKDGDKLGVDPSWGGAGQINELEFIGLPSTVFTVQETIQMAGDTTYRVTTKDYPAASEKGYFLDARFVTAAAEKPADRVPVLPSQAEIIARLRAMNGAKYVWGGNVSTGVPDMLKFFPPTGELDPVTHDQWILRGGDCSGILYEATNGFTPRNTSDLTTFGNGLKIQGLTAEQIVPMLQPLDLITWRGHLMIVIDNGQTIESRWDYNPLTDEPDNSGVHIRTPLEVLKQTMTDVGRQPVDALDPDGEIAKKQFVIRRWFLN